MRTREKIGFVLVPLVAALVGSALVFLEPIAEAAALNRDETVEARDLYWPSVWRSFLFLAGLFLVFRFTILGSLAGRWRKNVPVVAAFCALIFGALSFAAIWVLYLLLFSSSPLTIFGDSYEGRFLRIAGAWFFSYGAVAGLLMALFLPPPERKRDDERKAPVGIWFSRIGAVLILVLVTMAWLLPVLGWKKESDRQGCLMNIRNVQQGMRSWQSMNGYTAGEAIDWRKGTVGQGLFLEMEPFCPGGGSYTWRKDVPLVGELAIGCSCKGHVPTDYSEW